MPHVIIPGPDGRTPQVIDSEQPPFRIALDNPATPGSCAEVPAPTNAPRETVDGEATLWTWDIGDGEDALAVTCRFEPSGWETLATIEVQHRGPRRVREVAFPCVECHTNTFDRLLMASSWGDDIPRPCQTIREFCDAGGNERRMGMPYIESRTDEVVYYYPSAMAMQHMVLHNPARALYVACYGTDDSTKTFHAAATGKYDLALSVQHYPFHSGGTWSSPVCSLAVLKGGWHTAADLYASHMRPHFTPAERPEWMTEGFHGWIAFMMKQEGCPASFRYADLPRLYREFLEPTGINVLKISGWCNAAFDRNYPDYRVNPELGTADELKAACEEVRAMGGRVEFYTNMRLVDPESEFWRTGGDRFVCQDEYGEPYIEEYGTESRFRLACPACLEYAEYFAGEVRRMITEYGAAAMQTDQTSCNLDYLCFDASHPHATPATNFLPGLERTLTRVREVYRALDPEFYVWGEGCHERFGRAYDVHQGHGEEFTWQIGASTPEHFQFVYPDALVTGHAKTGTQGLCWSHAQGKPFDVFYKCLYAPDFAALLARFVAVRKAWPQYFGRGVFRDNEGLEVAGKSRAFGIHHRDGDGLLVNLWMPGAGIGQACSEQIKHPQPGWTIRVVDPPDAEVSPAGDWLEVRWRGPVVTLLFESAQ